MDVALSAARPGELLLIQVDAVDATLELVRGYLQAAGYEVVTAAHGAEGLEYRDREHLVLADDAESFTTAVSELLSLPVNRERIGAAGRRLYEELYTWPIAWKALAGLLATAARFKSDSDQ